MSAVPLHTMPGGIHPPECKTLSNREPIRQPPLPRRLIVPLAQHAGAPAEPCVAVGERVLKGQTIAVPDGTISAALHAPSSGTVKAIGAQPYPHASGLPAPAIVIDCDGLDEWIALTPCPDYRTLTPEALRARIAAAGIAGLGGAGFPSAAKLRAEPRIHTLIVNGAECEPYITADDRLMRERAAELVSGIDILVHLLAPDTVLIGIEDNKPEAIATVRAALGERPFRIGVVPTRYPSGGERQLIQLLTGREVPSGGLPQDIGLLCQNVGTCVAIHDAVVHGRPLISRITTLTGEALRQPMNVEALIGTPIDELLDFAGLDRARLDRLIMGGPLMGIALPTPDVPLIKTTNCLLAPTREELPPPPPALPCIRCGDCADACPARLLPQQLYFFAQGGHDEQLVAHHLFDCIECGACAYVCPSSIPLVQHYRAAKADLREQAQKRQKAEQARLRFEQRQVRQQRAEAQKEAERQARADKAARLNAAQATAPLATPEQPASAAPGEALKKLKIEASMAKVALKKAEKQLALHATPELEAQVAELRAAEASARQALEALEARTPPSPPSTADTALKKAKIHLALKRAELKKAEQAGADADTLASLQMALSAAEQALHRAEDNCGRPPPDLQRIDKRPVDETTRQLRTDIAFARAELLRLERAAEAAPAMREAARDRLAELERRLQAHRDTAPEQQP